MLCFAVLNPARIVFTFLNTPPSKAILNKATLHSSTALRRRKLDCNLFSVSQVGGGAKELRESWLQHLVCLAASLQGTCVLVPLVGNDSCIGEILGSSWTHICAPFGYPLYSQRIGISCRFTESLLNAGHAQRRARSRSKVSGERNSREGKSEHWELFCPVRRGFSM